MGPNIAREIGVFDEEKYVGIIDIVPNKNPDSIWIKIKKELCNEPDYTYTRSFYVRPDGKNSMESRLLFLWIYILLKKRGTIFIQGNLHARVGVETDFIEFDTSDEFPGIKNLLNQLKRNSEEKKLMQGVKNY